MFMFISKRNKNSSLQRVQSGVCIIICVQTSCSSSFRNATNILHSKEYDLELVVELAGGEIVKAGSVVFSTKDQVVAIIIATIIIIIITIMAVIIIILVFKVIIFVLII